MPSVFFSVAEPSADENVALVVRALRGLPGGKQLRVWGAGGGAMKGIGAEVVEETVAGAAMGVAAVGRAWEVSKLLSRIGARWEKDAPSLVVCSDSWSLNVHVARLAKKRGIPVLWYVAPQTWASREGRVKQLREVTDRVACILPFEEAYFRQRGVNATYVGHPLWDRIEVGGATRGFWEGSNMEGRKGPVVGILPGSRRGVVRANWPRLKEVMRRLRGEFPGITFRVPVTANAAELLGELPPDVVAQAGAIDKLVGGVGVGKDGAWGGCDLCVCVSGTAALHVAAHRVPMIVVYHGNPVLWHLIGRWVVRTRTFSLVNLLSGKAGERLEGRHVVPEYVPWYGSTAAVAEHAARLLRDPGALAAMRERLGEVMAPLARGPDGGEGASERVARMILEELRKKR